MYNLQNTTFVIFSKFGRFKINLQYKVHIMEIYFKLSDSARRFKINLQYKVHIMEIYFKLSDSASLREFCHLSARL